MRHFLAIAFAVCLACIATASHAQSPRPKTCLVLGGGGARGAAHIGVLKVLESEHVAIDCITGTSMGAIVGGLYAAGYTADDIAAILRGIDWKDMFNDDPPRAQLPMRRKDDELRFLGGIQFGLRDGRIALPRGAIQGQKLQLLLRRLLLSTTGVGRFDDLPIPFRSIATDIGSGDKVVFADGDLATAIRASMSVPAAFAPIGYRGRLLVDGGVVDNLPIDEARKLGAQRLIVVDVSEPLAPAEKLESPVSIANQMLTTLMKRQTDEQVRTLGADDVLLQPELGDLSSVAFDRSPEAIASGERIAQAHLAQLRPLAASAADYAGFVERHRQRHFDAPLIAFLDVATGHSRTTGYIEQRLSGEVGKTFDAPRLEEEIGQAYGEGSYERIAYQLQQKDGQTGLAVLPADKSWGPDFLRMGLRLSDNFNGYNNYQLFAEANFTGLNADGGESRNRVQIGQITELYSEFRQPWGATGEFYAAPYVQYEAYDFPVGSNGNNNDSLAEYRRSRSDGAIELGYTPGVHWQWSAALEYGRDAAHLRIGSPDFPNLSSQFGGVLLRAVYDDLDSSGFPTRGTRADVSYEELLGALGSSEEAHILRARWDTALSPDGSNHFLLGGSLSASSSGNYRTQIAAYSPLGGLGNLSGYTENQLFATQTALVRAIYYRRMTDPLGLFSVPFYLGGSLEAGGVWNQRRQIGSDLIGAGSLFMGIDTFLGPIFLGYGYAQGGHNAAYLTFGSLLRSSE